MKSNFILDLKVRFKGGVLSPLFYQNSTRLRGTQLVTALASRGERRRAARPAHLAHGDGEEGGRGWIVCPGGGGEEGKLGCAGRWALPWLMVGRPLAFLWKLSNRLKSTLHIC